MVSFDHAMIYVGDLASAARDYAALGFSVVAGGAHGRGPTTNALVPFADGSYLELIAFRRHATRVLLTVLDRLGLVASVVRSPLARRFSLRAARGHGLVDTAVCVVTVSEAIATARRAGVTVYGPVTGRRPAGDGAPVVWELGIPQPDELPLVVSDLTPRHRRAATAEASPHANGANGVLGLVVPVPDVHAAAALYRDVLGLPSHDEGDACSIALGATRLVLVPASGTPAGRPARLVLAAPAARHLDLRLAHGAVLDLAKGFDPSVR